MAAKTFEKFHDMNELAAIAEALERERQENERNEKSGSGEGTTKTKTSKRPLHIAANTPKHVWSTEDTVSGSSVQLCEREGQKKRRTEEHLLKMETAEEVQTSDESGEDSDSEVHEGSENQGDSCSEQMGVEEEMPLEGLGVHMTLRDLYRDRFMNFFGKGEGAAPLQSTPQDIAEACASHFERLEVVRVKPLEKPVRFSAISRVPFENTGW